MSPVTLETFSGSHYEIGVQQGKSNRELLLQAIDQLPNLDEVKNMKPRFLPTSLFLSIARRRAHNLLRNDISQYYPKQSERLKGIADGAGIDIGWVYLAHLMELLITVSPSSYHVSACTSLGFTPNRTKSRETIIAKNFDYPNHFAPYHLTCLTKPTEGYQTLGCTMAPLAGMIDGMNEHGLTVTQNSAYATDEPKHFAPNSLAMQEMLETCKNTDEAVAFITQAKHAGNHLLMIADAEGDIKTVEISHNYVATRTPVDDQLINTNHYHTPEMQHHEVPRNAVYSGNVPQEFLGTRVHESSEQRLRLAQDLLKEIAKVDENMLVTILSNHGEDNKPSNLTICQHGAYLSTLRSVVFYPAMRMLKILYGKPCQNTFSEFSFS